MHISINCGLTNAALIGIVGGLSYIIHKKNKKIIELTKERDILTEENEALKNMKG